MVRLGELLKEKKEKGQRKKNRAVFGNSKIGGCVELLIRSHFSLPQALFLTACSQQRLEALLGLGMLLVKWEPLPGEMEQQAIDSAFVLRSPVFRQRHRGVDTLTPGWRR